MDIKSINRTTAEPQIEANGTSAGKENENTASSSGISFTPDVLEAAVKGAESSVTMFDPNAQPVARYQIESSYPENIPISKEDEVLVQFMPGELREPYQIGELYDSEARPPAGEEKINWGALSRIKDEVAKENPDIKSISIALEELKDLPSAMEEEIAKWSEKLNAVGDDAQLANVDLQNILQKQQQVMQMMSNISKMLFDTANAVIRKLG